MTFLFIFSVLSMPLLFFSLVFLGVLVTPFFFWVIFSLLLVSAYTAQPEPRVPDAVLLEQSLLGLSVKLCMSPSFFFMHRSCSDNPPLLTSSREFAAKAWIFFG